MDYKFTTHQRFFFFLLKKKKKKKKMKKIMFSEISSSKFVSKDIKIVNPKAPKSTKHLYFIVTSQNKHRIYRTFCGNC
jgi:hypothetical protein